MPLWLHLSLHAHRWISNAIVQKLNFTRYLRLFIWVALDALETNFVNIITLGMFNFPLSWNWNFSISWPDHWSLKILLHKLILTFRLKKNAPYGTTKKQASILFTGSIFNNYWIRLSMIRLIIHVEIGVINRNRRFRLITETEFVLVMFPYFVFPQHEVIALKLWRHSVDINFYINVLWRHSVDMTISLLAVSQSETMNYFK
jgi:hypothetical protein